MALGWHVVRTKPHSDYLAAASLEREGFDLFFPRVLTPHAGKGYREVPLFPGYLFIRYLSDLGGWPAVHRLPGVSGWVRFEGAVPPVPDEVVAAVAERVERINGTGGLWKQFRPGDTVQVVNGKLDCLAEVLEEVRSPHERVQVLMEFLGRLVSVKIPWQDLRPVSNDGRSVGGRRGNRRTRGGGRYIRGFGPRAFGTA